jgi:hypothetical protein
MRLLISLVSDTRESVAPMDFIDFRKVRGLSAQFLTWQP